MDTTDQVSGIEYMRMAIQYTILVRTHIVNPLPVACCVCGRFRGRTSLNFVGSLIFLSRLAPE
jgi:hypothetical protein